MRSILLLAVFGVYICNVFGQEEIFPFICAEYDGATTNTSLIDYYYFNLTQTTTIKIDSCGSSYDTYLYFEEKDGTLIAECDDCGGCGSRAILDVEMVPAGEYRIGVGGFGTFFGTYTVDVTCAPPVPKNCSNGPFETVSFSNTINVSTDDVGATIYDTITVSGVTDRVYLVDVSIQAETTWVGDILIELRYNGQEITLLSYEGMDGDNVDVTISDSASEDCETKYFNNTGDDPRINGECNPDDELRLLLGNGSDINGNWTIEIFDLCDSCEPTNFGTWSLTFYTCPDDDCDKFIYVDTPMSFEDAQEYCQSEYGTSLAGVNKDDRPQANCAITDSGEPTWIGLYSRHKPAYFKFISGERCDRPRTGACVGFWGTRDKGIRAPKCLRRGGYKCGYYRESSQLVYNNLNCKTESAFLCEKYPVSYASIGLLEEIKDFVDEGINGDNVDNKNKFYITMVTTFAGFILIITLIFECIYCLCKCKKKEKVSYDKVGNEIEKVEESEEEESEETESEDEGVIEQDI